MKPPAPYDGHPNTGLFLQCAMGCNSIHALFDKIKLISDDKLKGDITEGLVKVMLDCKKSFGMKSVTFRKVMTSYVNIKRMVQLSCR